MGSPVACGPRGCSSLGGRSTGVHRRMRVTIFGSGYVGLVTGACLADAGNHVLSVDIDEAKVAALRDGQIPIYEPGLEGIIKKARSAGRLDYTTDAAAGVEHG